MALTRVTCPADSYTLLATGPTAAKLRVVNMRATTQVRLADSASLPAASVADYVQLSNRKWFELPAVGDNIYAMPIGSGAVIEVIAA